MAADHSMKHRCCTGAGWGRSGRVWPGHWWHIPTVPQDLGSQPPELDLQEVRACCCRQGCPPPPALPPPRSCRSPAPRPQDTAPGCTTAQSTQTGCPSPGAQPALLSPGGLPRLHPSPQCPCGVLTGASPEHCLSPFMTIQSLGQGSDRSQRQSKAALPMESPRAAGARGGFHSPSSSGNACGGSIRPGCVFN